MPAVEVQDLGLRLGAREVLAGLDFTVGRGEVFGVLGPNGAGKTTTVRLLNGLLRPTSGRMRVLGLDPVVAGDALRRLTGVLTEAPALYERLSGRENLNFFAELHGVGRAAVDGALAAVGLLSRAEDRAGSYSKGMQQRLAIARAVLHEPELLFLDEPTAGLDPEAMQQVEALVRGYRAAGRTVFLATHHLAEAERSCDRFACFAGGRAIAVGTHAELAALAGLGVQVVVSFAAPPPAWDPQAVPGATLRQAGPREWVFALAGLELVPAVVSALVEAGAAVMGVAPGTADLTATYLALVGGVAT